MSNHRIESQVPRSKDWGTLCGLEGLSCAYRHRGPQIYLEPIIEVLRRTSRPRSSHRGRCRGALSRQVGCRRYEGCSLLFLEGSEIVYRLGNVSVLHQRNPYLRTLKANLLLPTSASPVYLLWSVNPTCRLMPIISQWTQPLRRRS